MSNQGRLSSHRVVFNIVLVPDVTLFQYPKPHCDPIIGRSNDNHDRQHAPSIATLAGDLSRLSVERCIAELRAARPVLMHDAGDIWLLASAENADAQLVTYFRHLSGAALVLSAPRLRHLGLKTDQPQGFDLTGMDDRRIQAYCQSVTTDLPTNPVDTQSAAGPAIDLMKRAQLMPAALLARIDKTSGLAGLMSVDVRDISGYHDRIVQTLAIASRARVPLIDSTVTDFVVFHGGDGLKDQVAIVIGDPDPSRPTPVRLHSACLTGDLFGSLKCDCGEQLRLAIQRIAELGGGVLLYLDQEGRGIGLRSKIRTYRLQEDDHDTVDSDAILGYGPDERKYGIAGRMLELLGFSQIVMLTNNPDKIGAMQSAGLQIVGTECLLGTVNRHNRKYLATKAARAGHRLDKLRLTGSD